MPLTGSLLKRFVMSAGPTEIPPQFLYWAGLTMLAAVLQRHVWFDQTGWGRIYPNLYTILIGPGASGKGQAINFANMYVHSAVTTKALPLKVLRGRVTFAAIYDAMRVSNDGGSQPLWLISPELSNAFGRKDVAKEVVTTLTDIYESHAYTPYTKYTKVDGAITLKEPCITWLAGSTKEGFNDVIDMNDVGNGFTGRVALITGGYAPVRVPERDKGLFDAALEHIIMGLVYAGQHFQGEMHFSDEAQAAYNQWYLQRPPVYDDMLQPGWHRLPVTVQKLSMIHQISQQVFAPENDEWQYMPAPVLRLAIRDAEALLRFAGEFMDYFTAAQSNPLMTKMIAYLKPRGECFETELFLRFKEVEAALVLGRLITIGVAEKRLIRHRGTERIVVTWRREGEPALEQFQRQGADTRDEGPSPEEF